MKETFDWKENLSPREWDCILSSMGGHPLQSAMWGYSRKLTDDIRDTRWAAFKDGQPIGLVRFEERRFLRLIKVAWIPKGPTISIFGQNYESIFQEEFFQRLKRRRFFVCAVSPWKKVKPDKMDNAQTYTIWIDLTIGKEKLWENLDKQFRYDVRRATKEGAIVKRVNTKEEVNAFYKLAQSVSQNKGFYLNTSTELMYNLLQNGNPDSIESYLFSAYHDGNLGAGAFVIRCGESIHYIWGAVDRKFSKQRVGEAVQWGIVEWALSQNCKIYDLEGINPQSNDGVYNFKKKLGGNVVALPGEQVFPLNRHAKIAVFLRTKKYFKGFFKTSFLKYIIEK